MDKKNLIVNDVYLALRSSLLMVGKGRRPNLPETGPITKLRLVQLYYLRLEGQKTWKDVDEWILKLDPNLSATSLGGRSRGIIESCHGKFVKLSPEETEDFLSDVFDFSLISTFLTSCGITRNNIFQPSEFSNQTLVVTNEVIVELDKACHIVKAHKSLLHQWIRHLLNCEHSAKLVSFLSHTLKTYTKLSNNKSRQPDKFTNFIQETFCIPGPDLNGTVTPVKTPVATPSRTKVCFNCDEKAREIQSFRELIQDLQSEKSSLILQLDSANSKLQALKESYDSEVDELKKKLTKEKRSHKVLSAAMAENKENFTNLVESSDLKISQLKVEKKEKQKEIDALKLDVVRLQSKIDVKCPWDIEVKTGDKNAYSNDIVKTCISLVADTGVSAKNVQNVIKIVSHNLFHFDFTDKLPCQQTVLNFLNEGYVVSQIQTVEGILKSDNVTLHSDGTSRDHKKIVGHQLSLSNGETFYLGYAPVASENAHTLLDLSLNVVNQLVASYSEISGNHEELLKAILIKITSLMTDRASAMKLYGKLFADFVTSELGMDTVIHFLHCNAHFLLGLVSSSEKALISLEKSFVNDGGPLGRDKDCSKFHSFLDTKECATFRAIRIASSLLGPNGDQKNGCRVQWVTYCEKSLIPCFKSNRFNSHFETAAAIVFHHDKIKSFLTSNVLPECPNLKIQSLTCDILDDNLMTIICCLAVFYLKVTGPFWKLVNSPVNYSDFHFYVGLMRDAFVKCSDDPSDLFDSNCTSVFDNRMSIDSLMYDAVHEFAKKCNSDLLFNAMKGVCMEAINVTNRQLCDFLTDGYFANLDSLAKSQLSHCPLTNLIGESSFGDYDFDLSKRRNATLHNRSAVHCLKRNKTSHYLMKQSFTKSNKILKVARKRAITLKKENRELELKMRNDQKQIFINNQQKQIEKVINAVDKKSQLSKAVKSHGGPCTSVNELEDLIADMKSKNMSNKKIVEAVKSEVRYQKFVVGYKSLKLGKLEDMLSMLRTVLPCEASPKRHKLCSDSD